MPSSEKTSLNHAIKIIDSLGHSLKKYEDSEHSPLDLYCQKTDLRVEVKRIYDGQLETLGNRINELIVPSQNAYYLMYDYSHRYHYKKASRPFDLNINEFVDHPAEVIFTEYPMVKQIQSVIDQVIPKFEQEGIKHIDSMGSWYSISIDGIKYELSYFDGLYRSGDDIAPCSTEIRQLISAFAGAFYSLKLLEGEKAKPVNKFLTLAAYGSGSRPVDEIVDETEHYIYFRDELNKVNNSGSNSISQKFLEENVDIDNRALFIVAEDTSIPGSWQDYSFRNIVQDIKKLDTPLFGKNKVLNQIYFYYEKLDYCVYFRENSWNYMKMADIN